MTPETRQRLPPITDDELRALPPLIEVEPVARVFGCSTSLVYAKVRDGSFPFEVITFGRFRRFRRDDLLHYLGIDSERTAA